MDRPELRYRQRKVLPVSRLAVVGLLMFPAGVVVAILAWALWVYPGLRMVDPDYLKVTSLVLVFGACPVSVIALLRIRAHPDRLRGHWIAGAGMVLPLLFVLFLVTYTPKPAKLPELPPRPHIEQPSESSEKPSDPEQKDSPQEEQGD